MTHPTPDTAPTDHYRTLTHRETAVLQTNRCRSRSWEEVVVRDPFDPSCLFDTVFEGPVSLGPDPVIEQTRLSHVTIGEGCCIRSVPGGIRNTVIADRVHIENVGSIDCSPGATFGCGVQVTALNEGGGRELTLTALTSAQIGYLTVLYRHDPQLIERLEALAHAFVLQHTADHSFIGAHATIRSTGALHSVHLGSGVRIEGAASLHSCTIASTTDAPVRAGAGSCIGQSVILAGTILGEGVLLERCLVGEGCRMGKGFSAENSLFFANCDGQHSEVCSVFAGPFTVTHHRATLLIAGMFSFYNAGSGTNQSNHLYKLGPLHQGVLERGCKTGSGSYIMFPARAGAFTSIMGKHAATFNTSLFPFSHLNGEAGQSLLVPGMNVATVGTVRDEHKWRTRDRRTGAQGLDIIHPRAFSPFTAGKIVEGMATLELLYSEAGRTQEFVQYNGVRIKRVLIRNSIKHYQTALECYFGSLLADRACADTSASWETLTAPAPDGYDGAGEWIDAAGMLCPRSRLESLCASLCAGGITTQQALLDTLHQLGNNYYADEWNWFLATVRKRTGEELSSFAPPLRATFLSTAASSVHTYYAMVLADAAREFSPRMMVSYGIDGQCEDDFREVRGILDENPFVQEIRAEQFRIEKVLSELATRS